MKKKMMMFLRQHSAMILSLVVVTSQIASENCYAMFYQPLEPDDLAEFTSSIKDYKNNMHI